MEPRGIVSGPLNVPLILLTPLVAGLPKASVYDQHGNPSIAQFSKERAGYSKGMILYGSLKFSLNHCIIIEV